MNKRSLILGVIFILGQGLTQFGLFRLIFVNTDWGDNGLGAGYALLTIAITGFVSLFCGGILASSRFYENVIARTTFSIVISSLFIFMLTIELVYTNVVESQGTGMPHLMPVLYITMVLALWTLLQMTRKKE